MTVELSFFLFLIERYAQHKGKSTGDILKEWDAHGITQKIYDGYLEYHTERIEMPLPISTVCLPPASTLGDEISPFI